MNFRATIRTMLKEIGSTYQLPEAVLRSQIEGRLGGAVDEAQFQSDLKWLLDKAWVDYTIDPESGVKRWALTEEGRTR